MADIGRVADLAHFAIADHIDLSLNLRCHDGIGFSGHDRVKLRFVVIQIGILRKELIDHTLWTRQASDVGGEDAMGHVVVFLHGL